jgi:hypothetical protein
MENGKTDYFNVEDIQIYNGRERTAAIYPWAMSHDPWCLDCVRRIDKEGKRVESKKCCTVPLANGGRGCTLHSTTCPFALGKGSLSSSSAQRGKI